MVVSDTDDLIGDDLEEEVVGAYRIISEYQNDDGDRKLANFSIKPIPDAESSPEQKVLFEEILSARHVLRQVSDETQFPVCDSLIKLRDIAKTGLTDSGPVRPDHATVELRDFERHVANRIYSDRRDGARLAILAAGLISMLPVLGVYLFLSSQKAVQLAGSDSGFGRHMEILVSSSRSNVDLVILAFGVFLLASLVAKYLRNSRADFKSIESLLKFKFVPLVIESIFELFVAAVIFMLFWFDIIGLSLFGVDTDEFGRESASTFSVALITGLIVGFSIEVIAEWLHGFVARAPHDLNQMVRKKAQDRISS